MRFVDLTLNGLAGGAVYAAFALALVLIWRATRIVNFAQGAMADGHRRTSRYDGHRPRPAPTGSASWSRSSPGCVLGAVVERVSCGRVEDTPPLNAVDRHARAVRAARQALRGMIYGGKFRARSRRAFGDHAATRSAGPPCCSRPTTCSSSSRCRRDGRAGVLFRVHPRPADARGGVRAGGGPAARRPRGADAHAGLGAGRGGRRAGRHARRAVGRSCTRTPWTSSSSSASPRR